MSLFKTLTNIGIGGICMIFKNLARLGFIGIIKTVIFNFRFMPIRQAIHLPILLSSKVKVVNMRRNRILIDSTSNWGGEDLAF